MASPPKMKIYLAGPEVFLPDPIAAGETLKVLCTANGAEGLFPMDNSIPAHILAGTASTTGEIISVATWIRSQNMAMIRSCDGIVANMTPFRGVSMDVGTAYEMGVAAALGKVVIGYSTNSKPYTEKVKEKFGCTRDEKGALRDGDGMGVEEFVGELLVDNLMMTAGGIDNLGGIPSESVEEAVRMAVQVFEERQAKKI
jgi:nucleoside 2-deoxyribosyltransferase